MAMHQVLHDCVGDRNQEDRNETRRQHPTQDGNTEQDSAVRPRSRGEDERDDAEDKRERRHQNRAQPQAGGGESRLRDSLALFIFHLRELHDEDRVLGRQADQHDQADLGKDIVFQAEDPQARRTRRTPQWACRATR